MFVGMRKEKYFWVSKWQKVSDFFEIRVYPLSQLIKIFSKWLLNHRKYFKSFGFKNKITQRTNLNKVRFCHSYRVKQIKHGTILNKTSHSNKQSKQNNGNKIEKRSSQTHMKHKKIFCKKSAK